MPLAEFNVNEGLTFILTWSEKENTMLIGDVSRPNSKTIVATQKGGRVRVGRDGALYQVGDDNLKVGYYMEILDGKENLSPLAKELWDNAIEKVTILIDGCKLKDFIFETTLVQQCLVVLVTAFEVYTKNRFVEVEQEGKKPNNDAHLSEFIKEDEEKQHIVTKSASANSTIVQTLVENKIINFQDWDKCKTAYNKAYGIKFGELGVNPNVIQMIQKYIKWRHKIIHSKQDMSVLNTEKLCKEKPIFANKDLIEKAKDEFTEFIEILHKKTTL